MSKEQSLETKKLEAKKLEKKLKLASDLYEFALKTKVLQSNKTAVFFSD